MRILVLSSAEEEFAEAVDYYNEQRPGLGFEFALRYSVHSSESGVFQKPGRCFHPDPGDASPIDSPSVCYTKSATIVFWSEPSCISSVIRCAGSNE